jgi:aspartyl-tRNA(Asn)/glutamyl-tRNA(Gln) amidotransferase subunit A
MDIRKMTALEIGAAIKDRVISPSDATKAFLEAARVDEPHAFVSIDEEGAMEMAGKVQERIEAGEEISPLAGVPMALKDNMCMKGSVTTASSKMLENFTAPYDATVVEKLKKAGAVIIGKTNMDEFAMGSSTETSYFGITKNPWDESRVPGGSSGGSAAAVAGGLAPYALGSDTGGSIRQPCSFTGTTGLKPTYGSVSRYGLMAYASSLDQIGPIATDAKDCKAIYETIAGRDERDSTSIEQPTPARRGELRSPAQTDLTGKRIGIPANYFTEGLDKEVAETVKKAGQTLKDLGATVEEFTLPLIEYAVPVYLITACAEASSNLSRYDGVKYGYRSPEAKDIAEEYYISRSEGFGTEVRRRIMLGSFVLSSGYFDAYYKKALQVRGLIAGEFSKAFETYDIILSPTSPTTAFEIGGQIKDPLAMYLSDIYTVSVNLAGIPAVALPCGFDKKDLPVGMQLIGRAWDDIPLLDAAAAYQSVTDYHKKRAF